MAYSSTARALRRCTARRKDGLQCRAYACWDDPLNRCMAHAGRHHRGPMIRGYKPLKRTNYRACTCPAYAWPHKPGGGGCNWPGPPRYRLSTPAGTRREW
jgi:hypothetical protein